MLAASLAMVVAVTGYLDWSTYRLIRALIPADLRPGFRYRGSLGDVQGAAIFSIDADAARREVQRADGSNGDRRAWRPTPADASAVVFDDCSSFDCGTDRDVGREVGGWLARPGSYYRVVDDGSDRRTFVIAPGGGEIAVSYFRT